MDEDHTEIPEVNNTVSYSFMKGVWIKSWCEGILWVCGLFFSVGREVLHLGSPARKYPPIQLSRFASATLPAYVI